MNEKALKICFLAPANSVHIKKWCKWFNEHGHKTYVISFVDHVIEGTSVYFIDPGIGADAKDSSKIKYLFKTKIVKKYIDELKPDIVNVHYATSYGTVAALSGLKNYVLSVWGSDIYDFPNKSIFHRLMLQYSLHKAKYIFSTSQAMADEAHRYTQKHIDITPFGVDVQMFHPIKRNRSVKDGQFIVGTIKSLSAVYGIDLIIKAVAIIHRNNPEIPIRLRIAGTGCMENEYKELSKKLGIDHITTWLGYISQEEVASEWANMDVAVIPSMQESFGVSAVEAQASGIPVVIADVPGLKEATMPNKSSIIVKHDEREIAEVLKHLYFSPKECICMGRFGRKYVIDHYEIEHCFEHIEVLFFQICKNGYEVKNG